MPDDTHRILLNRLRQFYWPGWLNRLTLTRVLRSRPRQFESEQLRVYDRGYDAGRVHFLMRQLHKRRGLDPIEIDTTWHGNSPVGLVVTDGHHRLVAAVLAGRQSVRASVSGLVDMRRWLTGDTDKCPL